MKKLFSKCFIYQLRTSNMSKKCKYQFDHQFDQLKHQLIESEMKKKKEKKKIRKMNL